jgi:tetratricopeptide (TPR) repeat protein
MSEMLGNQYFMARNYKEAVKELEPVYLNDLGNKSIRRKLIIGYTQIGKIAKALELFIPLVLEDAKFIMGADPIKDDCPCKEIMQHLKSSPKEIDSSEFNIYNGILYLYCEPKKSLKFFKRAMLDFPENEEIKKIILIIKKHIEN